MKKRKFPIALILGAALLLVSLALVAIMHIRVHTGAKSCGEILAKMDSLLPERSAGVPDTYTIANMPVMEIDGNDYAALLRIPSLDVALPVADEWNSGKLHNCPARFWGSAYNGTLVIGGADSSYQFSFCDKIDNGTTVTVTDMTGAEFNYTVARVDRSKNAEGEWLRSEEHDLTLFCRDTYSMEYIAVRCSFVGDR